LPDLLALTITQFPLTVNRHADTRRAVSQLA
jgi:hypothetical protein